LVDARRFGAKGELAQSQRVEECRSLSGEDLINTGDYSGRKHGFVDDPEFEQERVEPFSGFKVGLESPFVCFSIDVISYSPPHSLDACAIVGRGYCQDEDNPSKSGAEPAQNPAEEATEEYDSSIVPPGAKVLVSQSGRQPILVELLVVRLVDASNFTPSGFRLEFWTKRRSWCSCSCCDDAVFFDVGFDSIGRW